VLMMAKVKTPMPNIVNSFLQNVSIGSLSVGEERRYSHFKVSFAHYLPERSALSDN